MTSRGEECTPCAKGPSLSLITELVDVDRLRKPVFLGLREYHRNNFLLLNRSGVSDDALRCSPVFGEVGALAARGDAEGHRRRNFVPKLGSIGYYHATCNCAWNGIIVRQGTARLVHHDLRSDSVCG
jgi:hypothetical protein